MLVLSLVSDSGRAPVQLRDRTVDCHPHASREPR